MQKRIQFITHYNDLYGANRSLLTLIEYFHCKDYAVNVLLPSNGSMARHLKRQGIAYDVIFNYGSFLYIRPKLKHIVVPLLGLFNIFIFPYIVYKIRKFNPDIIYSNTSAENIGVFASKFLKVKHISHIREFMSLDHESYFIFGKTIKRKFIEWSDGVIFVSKAVAEHIKGDLKFKTLNKVIYNGLKIPNVKPNSVSVPIAIKFGIVGLIDPAKGQLQALQYFSNIVEQYPHSTLHIYGTGSGKYYNKLIESIDQLKLNDKVILHGFVDDIERIYSFDVLMMFSRSEGFGRVTVEAMMRGIPVIGMNSAGTSELINNGKTGYLFKDQESFNESLSSLFSTEYSFNLIRMKAFESSSEQFNDKKYNISIESFINKVLIHKIDD